METPDVRDEIFGLLSQMELLIEQVRERLAGEERSDNADTD